jgi:predicted dinucleotide-binding enzyme
MRIGILGSGLTGDRLGTIFARAGHEVVFRYARSKRKLEDLARNAKGEATFGSPREAALWRETYSTGQSILLTNCCDSPLARSHRST